MYVYIYIYSASCNIIYIYIYIKLYIMGILHKLERCSSSEVFIVYSIIYNIFISMIQ